MPLRNLYAGALTALAVTCSGDSPAQSAYKWVDEEGVTQYSQLPPPGQPAQAIKPPPSVDSEAALQALRSKERSFAERRAAERKAEAERAAQEAEAAQRRAKCESARDNLSQMQNAQRVYAEEDGERVRIAGEELEARIRKGQEAVDIWCNPAPPKPAQTAAAPEGGNPAGGNAPASQEAAAAPQPAIAPAAATPATTGMVAPR